MKHHAVPFSIRKQVVAVWIHYMGLSFVFLVRLIQCQQKTAAGSNNPKQLFYCRCGILNRHVIQHISAHNCVKHSILVACIQNVTHPEALNRKAPLCQKTHCSHNGIFRHIEAGNSKSMYCKLERIDPASTPGITDSLKSTLLKNSDDFIRRIIKSFHQRRNPLRFKLLPRFFPERSHLFCFPRRVFPLQNTDIQGDSVKFLHAPRLKAELLLQSAGGEIGRFVLIIKELCPVL